MTAQSQGENSRDVFN